MGHVLSDLSTWPSHLEWPHMAWLSFIELDKAVVQVIRLASWLWLWFQSVHPVMPSLSAYHLPWVSLTLDVGCLFTTAPAKHSRCSLCWTRGISSRTPLLTLNMEYLLSTLLCPRCHCSFNVGLLLTAPDFRHVVAALSHCPDLWGVVAHLSHHPWPRMWSSSPRLLPLTSDHYVYYCGQESLIRNGVAIIVNKRVRNAVFGYNLKNDRMISVHYQSKSFNITVIQAYAPTSNAE